MEERQNALVVTLQQSLEKGDEGERWIERINPILRKLIDESSSPNTRATGEHTKFKVEFSKSSGSA